MAKARGDRSKPATSSKRSQGPAATQKSMATSPKGRKVTQPGGRNAITDGRPA